MLCQWRFKNEYGTFGPWDTTIGTVRITCLKIEHPIGKSILPPQSALSKSSLLCSNIFCKNVIRSAFLCLISRPNPSR